eukprot:CAMPEP_0117015562 /NCGR_PEP_ID=MMETSP0472-20121206/12410_1 /TAXON_ID=693140 ORGANISM="Tiarina fusus, Strain LIS" /NCGR_SAMPLE_ID=MMETSP0472 /ASSEMBLY_ACC=CAM_ASM_000603 /LENGTH=132 /DNA_ID=CAMNT_0004719391 /DNA_START=491 /DNA_END=889 /DNA_ORIENTATION=-
MVVHVVLAFNLALAYHLAALHPSHQNGGNNETTKNALLQKASDVYKYALHFLRSSATRIRSTRAAFRLAALNNLANICLALGDEVGRIGYLEQILSVTAIMTSYKREDPKWYEAFFESSLCLIRESYGAGAA